MPAAEHVERQIAVAVVIAVEKTFLLMAVQRVVGGVEVERDLRRRCRMRVEKQIDKQTFDRRRIMTDLVIAGRFLAAQFQTIERRFASQRRTIGALGFELAAEHRQHRVMAQLIMVVQVLIAQRNPEHPLTHQPWHLVHEQIGITIIGEAVGKARHQPDLFVGGAEQHRPGLRGHRATIECGHHLAPFDGCKAKQIRAPLCLHRDAPWS
jgi:hypothetical protein